MRNLASAERRLLSQFGEDTRFARRASREMDGLKLTAIQGSPPRVGQPWADIRDTFGVVIMRAVRGTKN